MTAKTTKKRPAPRQYTCQNATCPYGVAGKPKQFAGRHGHTNKYCCQACYWMAKRGETRPPEVVAKITANHVRTLAPKACAYCHATFTPTKSKQLYCTQKHAAAARGDKLRGKPRGSTSLATYA